MKKLALAAIFAAASAAAAEPPTVIDTDKWFAYYSGNMLVLLSRQECKVNKTGWDKDSPKVSVAQVEYGRGYAKSTVAACWWKTRQNVIMICQTYKHKDGTMHIGSESGCEFIDQSYFRETSSLPKSAF